MLEWQIGRSTLPWSRILLASSRLPLRYPLLTSTTMSTQTSEVKDPNASQSTVTDIKDVQTASKEQEPTTAAAGDTDTNEPKAKRGLRFWLVYVALCLSLLLAALDLVGLLLHLHFKILTKSNAGYGTL